MSELSAKLERRNLRRAVGETAVGMIDEHQTHLGKLDARCEALERMARVQKDLRDVLEARVSELESQMVDMNRERNGWADLLASLTWRDRWRFLLTGRIGR